MDQDAIVNEIRERFDNMDAQDHYAFLGVENDAEGKTIHAAYRGLARRLHVDRFRNHQDPDLLPMVEAINKRINEAFSTLNDAKKREAYDAEISGEAEQDSVSSSEIEEIFAAEDAFRRGKAFIERGEFKNAHERFAISLKVNPDDIDTQAYHTFSGYMCLPVSSTGRRGPEGDKLVTDLRKLSKEAKENPTPALLLGKVLKLEKDTEGATRAFRRALNIDPNNKDAQREMRLVMSRKDDDKPASFMDKIAAFFTKKR